MSDRIGGRAVRLPRLRLSLRWMMALVAVVALGLWVERMRELSQIYEMTSRSYESLCLPVFSVDTALPAGEIEDWERRYREYQGAMREKYRRAARFPWLPVAPDLPYPE